MPTSFRAKALGRVREGIECSPAVALRAVALAMSHSVRFDHGKGSSYLYKKHKEDGVAGIHLPPDTSGKSESVVAQAEQEPYFSKGNNFYVKLSRVDS